MTNKIELIRIDDVCDRMKNPEMFWNTLNMLYTYGVRPLIGVIPNNKDYKLIDEKSKFKIEDLKKHLNKVDIALHGFSHKYENENGGILNISKKSEFAGVSFDIQKDKITKGLSILKNRLGVKPRYFFAPSHSYDRNTLRILREYNMCISDGISRYPFINEVFHIPQCTGMEQKYLEGVYTLHLHTTTMSNGDYERLRKYLLRNEDDFKSFDDILPLYYNKNSPFFNAKFRVKLSLYNFIKFSKSMKYNWGKQLIRGYLKKATLLRLQKVYEFNNWHLSPIEHRPYALDIVKDCNEIIKGCELKTAVEVGCGLGDIISRLKCDVKVGYDTEDNVIRAAQKINGKKCSFKVGSFQNIQGSEIDMLIAVNFMHNIPSLFSKYNDICFFFLELNDSSSKRTSIKSGYFLLILL